MVVLAAGIVVVALTFGLLSSETATSQISVTSTLKHNFRAAYEILVRPKKAATFFEDKHHVVADGFLSGLFGGITMHEYRVIKSLPGVSLAAPVANVGYFTLDDHVFVPFPKTVPKSDQTVYKVTVNWDVHHGLSSYPSQSVYVYWTTKELTFSSSDTGDGTERVNGRRLDVCEGFTDGAQSLGPSRTVIIGPIKDPYKKALVPQFECASAHVLVTGAAVRSLQSRLGRQETIAAAEKARVVGGEPSGRLGVIILVQIPVLVAGVDPDAENALVGLRNAMTTGTYLKEGAGLSPPESSMQFVGAPKERKFPVIASTDTYLDQVAELSIQRLRVQRGTNLPKLLSTRAAYKAISRLSGPAVGHMSLRPNTAWRTVLKNFATDFTLSYLSPGYWRVSPTRYALSKSGVITPATVTNNPSVWTDNNTSPYSTNISLAPPGSNDTWYRHLKGFGESAATVEVNGQDSELAPAPMLTGTFNPSKLRGFSPLSRVPLQTFYPPTVSAGNQTADKSLGSSALGPTTNLGGYISQPPLLLTTLQGAIALDNGDGESYNVRLPDGYGQQTTLYHESAYQGASPRAPISVVQVRVKGVTGPNALSLARVKVVAEQIAQRTGLTVDITAGSSPIPEPVQLAAGNFGQPRLLVVQNWVKKDVDSTIIRALSDQDLDLFGLVLITCGMFVASTTTASVRQRRREIAILRSLGWPAQMVFSLVLGEAALAGLVGALLGAVIAAGVASAGALTVPLLRLGLAVPVGTGLTMAAAALPALQASRTSPLEALRQTVRPERRHRRVRTAATMAVANVLRLPGRTVVAVLTLVCAVWALTVLLGVTIGFRGAVAGDLLGSVVSFDVRTVDTLSAGLMVAVGAGAVGDVFVANLQDRVAELATLRALGWRDRKVARVIIQEGLLLGATGSAVGAVLGLVVVVLLGAGAYSVALAAAIATTGGTLLSGAALVIPVYRLSRQPPGPALAAE